MSGTAAAWAQFAEAQWDAAREAFAAVLAASPGDPDALDGLGQSLWWLGEREQALETRREAYAAFRYRGDRRHAARVAVYLAGEHRIDRQESAAAGWLARARRLLDGIEPRAEHGLLWIEEAKRAATPDEAERLAAAAATLARMLDDPAIECMALAQLGRAMVRQGRVDEGTEHLDEAMTIALSESSDAFACGDACCTTLAVCDGLADLARASEWCHAVVEFADRRRFTPVQTWCRSILASVLLRAGDWKRAEEVLLEALRPGAGRPTRVGRVLPLALLAELRLRQGRPDEAARLLEGLEDHPESLAPSVLLAIARGSFELAEVLLTRHEEVTPVEQMLALHGALALAARETATARDLAAQLDTLARRLDRPDLAAAASFLDGKAAVDGGDHCHAADRLGAAVTAFSELGFPWEEAQARLALAGVEAATGSPLAIQTARAARDVFERLGARQEADEAAALLRSLGASGRTTTRGERDDITRRELEVLALVVDGLSNAEIARRLVISPKTAEHHVGRLLTKLGVRSRAEAAAHAVREGIV